MSSLAWLIIFLIGLSILVVFVYYIVVKAYYWGDRSGPPVKERSDQEKPQNR